MNPCHKVLAACSMVSWSGTLTARSAGTLLYWAYASETDHMRNYSSLNINGVRNIPSLQAVSSPDGGWGGVGDQVRTLKLGHECQTKPLKLPFSVFQFDTTKSWHTQGDWSAAVLPANTRSLNIIGYRPTQICFPIVGECVTCYGSKLTNSLG